MRLVHLAVLARQKLRSLAIAFGDFTLAHVPLGRQKGSFDISIGNSTHQKVQRIPKIDPVTTQGVVWWGTVTYSGVLVHRKCLKGDQHFSTLATSRIPLTFCSPHVRTLSLIQAKSRKSNMGSPELGCPTAPSR